MSDAVTVAAIAGGVAVIGTLGTLAAQIITLMTVRSTKREVREIKGAMTPPLQNRQRGTPAPGRETPRDDDARTRHTDNRSD